jgi:hypothetical protein
VTPPPVPALPVIETNLAPLVARRTML